MKRIRVLTLALGASVCVHGAAIAADAPALQVISVQSGQSVPSAHSVDAVVEAVRQTTLSTQVAGAVVALQVKASDRVKAGQELLRIDARAAQQGVIGAHAQVEAAQSQLAVATQELERQRQLLQKQYISQGAFDRAQAQWDAAKAQLKSLQAQTQVAQAQSGFFVVKAPYAGVISEVSVTLGDMAMPGRALLTMHDPSAMRVSASVPQALLAALSANPKAIRFELPGVAAYATPQVPQQVQVLPAVDPVTHTGQIRLSLPAGMEGLAPGMFAKVWLPSVSPSQASSERLFVPASAIVRRAEMTGVYVVNAQGKPSLRQVRLGSIWGDRVEVLSGLRKEEQVAVQAHLAGAVR